MFRWLLREAERREPEQVARRAVAARLISVREAGGLEACHDARLRVLAADELDPAAYRGPVATAARTPVA